MNIVTYPPIETNKNTSKDAGLVLGTYLTVVNPDKPHPRVNQPKIVMAANASYSKVKRYSIKGCQVGGGIRGHIKEFSRASARRLMDKVMMIPKRDKPLFVTLTYSDASYQKTRDAKNFKRDLQVFTKRMKRRFPKMGIIWRLEIIDRKSGLYVGELFPHYHLLVYGIPHKLIHTFRQWLSLNWFQVVGSNDVKHLRAGTNATIVRSHNGVKAYASKRVMGRVVGGEISKDRQSMGENVGRWWGIVNPENIGIPREEDLLSLKLTDRQACNMIRLFRRYAKIKSRAYRSLTCYIDVDWWCLRISDILECCS